MFFSYKINSEAKPFCIIVIHGCGGLKKRKYIDRVQADLTVKLDLNVELLLFFLGLRKF